MRGLVQSAFMLLLALSMAACAAQAPAPAAPSRPGSGLPELDRSCRADADCAVKNVGNCCGYFPACVNSAAEPDPAAVQAACAQSGMGGVCGFREIQACACVASRCEPAQSGDARSGVPPSRSVR